MVIAHDITKGERTRDVKISENVTFKTMLLSPNTLSGLKDSGFYKPSPIQLYGIPIGKCGFDLLLEAKSGTGKTAVFSIIALEKLDFCKGLQVVILAPTREIAAQICDVLKQIGSRYKDLKIEVVMGGLPLRDDIEKFKNTVHIVVGSPGRLKQLIQNKYIDLTCVRLLVLDEADKLMEKSFQSDIHFIYTALPKQKQVIMSSATYPEDTKNLINSYVQNASHVCPDSDSVLLGIEQKVTFVKYNNNIVRQTQDKFRELYKILVEVQFKQCLIFCNYKARVSEVHKLLKKQDWPSQQLYGQQEQIERLDALKTLQEYKCRILVSTDLAARGIDASNIDLVINFEPPYDWQTYLHRIGRAGRYGSYGLAITILNEDKEQYIFREMLKILEHSINIRFLWTDKEFKLDNLTQPTDLKLCSSHSDNPHNLQKEVNVEVIWELLIKSSTETNTLDSFETLCKSHQQANLYKIDTFVDLMLSLKDIHSNDSEENISFKHIKMIPNTGIYKQQKTLLGNKNKDVNENTETFVTESNKDEVKNNLKEILSDSSGNMNENVNCNAENILYSTLPTKFSSSKHKFNKSKPSHHNGPNSVITNSINHNQGNGSKSVFENKQVKPKLSNPIEINHSSKSSKNYLSNESKIYNNDERVKPGNRDNRFCSLMEQDQSSFCTRIEKRVNQIEQTNRRKVYTDWYYQLKMKMKYMQQAIYIDEISRS